MIDFVEVYLWGNRIAFLSDGDNGISTFEYDKDFILSGIEVSPFNLKLNQSLYSFPELSHSSAFHGLPGLVADSLPDKFGNAVINAWLSSQGRLPESFSALERLCYTGKRGMGALEYKPALGIAQSSSEIDVTEMTRFASEILSGRESRRFDEKKAGKMQLLEIGSSAGGARAKAVIAWNESTGEIKSGQINAGEGFDYWLIKFDGVSGNGDHELTDPKQYTLIEYAYYLMAKKLGIDMTECRVYSKDGLNHFMTKRFDRVNGQKLHMQTLGALCHYDYNIPGLCSYEEYANRIKYLVGTQSALDQAFRRLVFAVKGLNCDDHVKNFSFLMNKKGEWSISPAYDITFAYNPSNRWISRHQMTINGKTIEITDEDLLACGKSFNISPSLAKEIITETQTVLSDWYYFAEQSGMTEERAEEIFDQLKDSNSDIFDSSAENSYYDEENR